MVDLSDRNKSGLQKSHRTGKKVLILGSGFGGTSALRHLIKNLKRNEDLEIVMVSNQNFFLFSPMIHEVATGRIEPRHITYPLRRFHCRDIITFIQADVERIDFGNRQVETTAGKINFDYLVLALGGIPGKPEFCSSGKDNGNIFTLSTLNDSISLRNHIIRVFERASKERDPERQKQLLTFVVTGGGYTGVQLITELRDFIFRDLVKCYRTIDRDNIRIVLIETKSKILPQSHPKFSRYAARYLQRKDIELMLESTVTYACEDSLKINYSDTINTETVIWTTGLVTNVRTANLDVDKDNFGRLIVNEYMEVQGCPGVFAVGDCAHSKNPKTGQPIPGRAHNAVRQAKVIAYNILADLRNGEKRPYHYSNPFDLVTLGTYDGMFRYNGLRVYGFPARLIGIGGYTMLMVGVSNRIKTVMDRIISGVFGRNTIIIE